MSRLKIGGMCLVLLMAASVCVAQQPGRQGGRGGRGFGGFGRAQVAGGLLSMPEVRTELQVTTEQASQIDSVLQAAREQLGGGNFQQQQGLSDEERQKQRDERRAKAEVVQKEAEAKVATILNADQMKRLDELRVQRDGVNALFREEVAAALALTDEQQQKLQAIRDEGRQAGQRGQGGQNPQDLTDEQRRALFAQALERRAKTEADMTAVLTDEQQAALNAMKGTEFQFPQRGFGRGGQRPDGDAPGGQRRRNRGQNANPAAG
jgi:hypothetical protein